MAQITLGGNPINSIGSLPTNGTQAPAFTLTAADLSDINLDTFKGRRIVLNIFPSIDTDVCAASVRQFNEKAASLDNTTVLAISMDLPFALKRFCGAEGIDNVTSASAFRSTFGQDYGVTLTDGPLAGLLSRAIVVIDTDGTIIHTEQVPEIGQEPNYEATLKALA
ncbi:thiol peroxidase [Dermatophilus congolensis]|uniref:Thiol peroxidase n=1 Tax=Dermatophilus congolensis TaxID=1863 RepID=A0A239VGV1_9MICO|nr:thiol peroxidase [Dermatophilus congolensis]MBO3128879.1 thiol peroxidase [Dermatophilus congolensis]MBO3132483.1 thiol peroxidase [Dermatophilus congolensis]MBO3133356.1 thiol peroxidase [Dermatophilus congolensis]MBO3135591.1 thiol peroxidase [Dermatophilus congolensis]MBO3137830.1 thiol peroxidase [Dermatophilus congolensis]